MKKIFLVAVAVLFSGIIYAQHGNHRQKTSEDIAEQQTEKMKTALALSDQQYASVRGINQKYADLMAKLRSDTSLVREERHTKMKEIQTQKKSEIDQVLSAEQKQKWEEYRMSSRKGKHGSEGRKGQARRDNIKQSLNLSDDQSTKMAAAHQSFKDQLRAIQTDKQLSDDQRKEKASAARTGHEKEVQSILSDEQFKEWKALKKEQKKHKKLKREHYYKK